MQGLRPGADCGCYIRAAGETVTDQQETLDLVEFAMGKGGRIHSHYFTPLPGMPLEYAVPSPVGRDVNRVMERLALAGRLQVSVSREFADDTRLDEPHRDLLIDARCTVDVHDPRVLEYPGVYISHDPSDVVSLSST